MVNNYLKNLQFQSYVNVSLYNFKGVFGNYQKKTWPKKRKYYLGLSFGQESLVLLIPAKLKYNEILGTSRNHIDKKHSEQF